MSAIRGLGSMVARTTVRGCLAGCPFDVPPSGTTKAFPVPLRSIAKRRRLGLGWMCKTLLVGPSLLRRAATQPRALLVKARLFRPPRASGLPPSDIFRARGSAISDQGQDLRRREASRQVLYIYIYIHILFLLFLRYVCYDRLPLVSH